MPALLHLRTEDVGYDPQGGVLVPGKSQMASSDTENKDPLVKLENSFIKQHHRLLKVSSQQQQRQYFFRVALYINLFKFVVSLHFAVFGCFYDDYDCIHRIYFN